MRYYFTRDIQGKPLQMFDYSGYPVQGVEIYWYQYDAHGNVIGLWDKNGNQVVTYKYDAWGNVTETGSMYTKDGVLLREANPFKYSGYQHDKETGFYYLKSRYYSPYLGRFITRDVVLSINRYAYAGNNPVNFIDPNGMLEVVDARGDIVQLPNGNIINRRTGENLPSNKLKEILIENLEVTIENKAVEKPLDVFIRSNIKKLPIKKFLVGKGSGLGVAFSLMGKAKPSRMTSLAKGGNFLGVVSTANFVVDGFGNYQKYQSGAYTLNEFGGRTAITGMGLVASAAIAAALTPATAGFVASALIVTAVGIAVEIAAQNIEYYLYGY